MRISSIAKLFVTAIPAMAIAVATIAACSGQLNNDPDSGRVDAAMTVTTLYPDAAPLPGQTECKVVISRNIPITGQTHVPLCSPVSYSTNPPSGGDHWPEWAAYRTYDVPVSRQMYVHNLEHGAVVLTYRCEQTECPEVVRALGNAFRAARDPFCAPSARMLMTQDKLLATPLAASAWGATYTATCIDEASLSEFVNSSIGKGTEALCFDGTDIQSAGDPCAFLKDLDASADALPIVDAMPLTDGGSP